MMKKCISLTVAILLALSLTACCIPNLQSGDSGQNNPHNATGDQVATQPLPTEPAVQWPNDELAVKCLESIICAATAEDAAAHMTDDSKERAQDVMDYYPDEEPTIYVEFKGETDNYDVFYYEIKFPSSEELFETGMVTLWRDSEQYLICVNGDQQQVVMNTFLCGVCGGTGTIVTSGQTTCGICGGSGWQYIPNAYYDAALNMWMGQNVGCGGCGGSGQIAGNSSSACGNCGGVGYIFGD